MDIFWILNKKYYWKTIAYYFLIESLIIKNINYYYYTDSSKIPINYKKYDMITQIGYKIN
jgi:hypothetical protein